MATQKSDAPSKAAKKVAVPVQTITITIPLKGKPFTSFKDVINAYHNLNGYAEGLMDGTEKLHDLDWEDKLSALNFLIRLSQWDGKAEIEKMIASIVASLSPEA